MLKDFAIENAIGIRVQGVYFDLHNDFELRHIIVDFEERSLTVVLTRTRGAGSVSPKQRVLLRFSDLSFVCLSEGALKGTSRGVLELGYKNPDDSDHDWLIGEHQKSSADHLFVRLSNDEFVRVHSETASAIVEPRVAS